MYIHILEPLGGRVVMGYMALRLLHLRPLLLTSLRSPILSSQDCRQGRLECATSADSPCAQVPPAQKSKAVCNAGWCPETHSTCPWCPGACLQPSDWVASAFSCQPQLRRPISNDCNSSPFLSPAVFPTGGRSDRLMAVCAGLCGVP